MRTRRLSPLTFGLFLLFSGFAFPPLLCTRVSAQLTPGLDSSALVERSQQMMIGIEDAATIDAMMVLVPGIGSAARAELSRQNVKSYMMPIRQVSRPSHEWAYALTSALEYYTNLNENFKDNLSPDYLIMSLANQGKRPNMEDGLRFLVAEGTVSANIVPYGSTTIPGAVYSVPKVRITNFFYLFRQETRGRNRLFELKKALSRGNPVLVELKTPAGFAQHTGYGYVPAGPAVETHFLNVVGYDAKTEMLELRASFGRRWGEAGYIQLSYADFNELSVQGFVLVP